MLLRSVKDIKVEILKIHSCSEKYLQIALLITIIRFLVHFMIYGMMWVDCLSQISYERDQSPEIASPYSNTREVLL